MKHRLLIMCAILVFATMLTINCSPPPEAPAPQTNSNTNLSGVEFVFPQVMYRFSLAQAAAGITINYEVVVAQDITNVIPMPLDSGASQNLRPCGLMIQEELSGGDYRYCIADTGLSPDIPDSSRPSTTLHRGRYPMTFTWKGHSWNGPSDFNNPLGAAFPAGRYTLKIATTGFRNKAEESQRFNMQHTITVELY